MSWASEGERAAFLACALAGLFEGARSIAIGANSPIPAMAALLAKARHPETKLIVQGSAEHNFFTGGGAEQFDFVAQGRLDAFVLGGAQIDGQGNVNLVAVGDYARPRTRFPGSFGAAFVYYMIPRVILFSIEHSPRVLVPRVDFISAPGAGPPGLHRPGGPTHLLTGKALFAFDREHAAFHLESVHPGSTVDQIIAETGFAFEHPDHVETTPGPSRRDRELLRGKIGAELSAIYPDFMSRAYGTGADT